MIIKSVKHALNVLEVFVNNSRELGVGEVARALKKNKSTISRLMVTLESGQYLVKDSDSKKYHLGSKILLLSSTILGHMELRKVAAPYLRQLVTQINETVDLYILDGDHRVSIERIEAQNQVRMAFQIGNAAPLYAGAGGKLLLAFLSEEKRGKFINEIKLQKYTETTITSKVLLRKELEKIHREEIAISRGEYVDLFTSIAVPIRDSSGMVIAALNMAGVSSRFTPQKIKEYTQAIREKAYVISKELGYLG